MNMTNVRQSIKGTGWRNWLDEHRSPYGFGANEFDVLAQEDAPISLFVRIWKKDRRTIQKYLNARQEELSTR